MKTEVILGVLAVVSGVVSGQEVDPFAPVEPPKNVRVQVEFVEVAHREFTSLMAEPRESADATALRMKLAEMVGQDRAVVVETMMVVARSGKDAECLSNQEFILPVAYSPPQLPTPGAVLLRPDDLPRIRLRIPLTPTAFETRNLGSTFEVVPEIAADGRTIDLQFAPELVSPAGCAVWQEFTTQGGLPHQTTMPTLITSRVMMQMTCRSGQYALAAVLTPQGEGDQLDPSRKTLVLVKCDVLEVR